MEPRTQQTKKTRTKKVSEQTTLSKSNAGLLQNISPSLLINILILLLTAFGTYFAVISNMDSRLDKAIDIKVSKYQEKLDNLIAKGEEINDINAKTKDNQRIVALISDFGVDDYYLSVIKGKILQNNEHTNIIDITHGIRPFDEIEGAWILHNATKYLPEETIIWGMVNPGAKLSDNSLFLITNNPKQYFIGASKNLFDNVIANQGLEAAYKPIFIDNDDKYGTTTFTELINVLQKGGTVDELKDKHLIQRNAIEYDEPVLPTTKSPIWKDNSVSGYVCSIDRWGNILTNIKFKSPFFQIGKKYSVEINSKKITDFIYGGDYSAGEGKAGVIIEQDDWIQVAVYLGYANKSFEINKTGYKVTICKEN